MTIRSQWEAQGRRRYRTLDFDPGEMEAQERARDQQQEADR
jgi:hypothetical protein